jgi:hypothetical protein
MNLFQLVTRKTIRVLLSVVLGLWLSTQGVSVLAENIFLPPATPTPSAIPSSTPGISKELSDFYAVKNINNYVSSREYFGDRKGKFNENSYWSHFPIPKISKKFTLGQRKKIWKALAIAQARMTSDRVLDCIETHTVEKQYSDETAKEAVQRLVVNAQQLLINGSGDPLAKKRRQYLYIENEVNPDADPNDYRAWTFLGYSRDVNRDMTINLNTKFISKNDVDTWAGITVHEILHVYSYTHEDFDTSQNYYEQFKGNLVFEAAWCISSGGNETEYAYRSGSINVFGNPSTLPNTAPIPLPSDDNPLPLPGMTPTPLPSNDVR